jgi:hypothetical protein
MNLKDIGKLGSDEGRHTGPPDGDGSSSVGGMVAGDLDMEGTAPDEVPPKRQRDETGPSPSSS